MLGDKAKGRTIVRLRSTTSFNGGPDNCPARPADTVEYVRHSIIVAFNGGPDNCPARPTMVMTSPSGQLCRDGVLTPFNGGPDNCPARPNDRQLSGAVVQSPSMEGRTIVRPDPPFSGSCISRPQDTPSMEGRTIVRPDKGLMVTTPPPTSLCLQWRAGQLSGQTSECQSRIEQARQNNPSMEGRTIVRPDGGDPPDNCTTCHRPFNGGPDNCPARPGQGRVDDTLTDSFPSMEGRTIVRPDETDHIVHPRACHDIPSMEGRTIVRPDTSRPLPLDCAGTNPSMEGRTIVRPDES